MNKPALPFTEHADTEAADDTFVFTCLYSVTGMYNCSDGVSSKEICQKKNKLFDDVADILQTK